MVQIEPGRITGDFAEDATMPLPGAGEFGQPQIIGGFAGARTGTLGSIAPAWAQNAGFGRPITVSDPSFQPYYQGDEFVELKGMTTEDRVRLQQQMVALGLMSGKNVPYGEIDGGEDGRSGTLGAMRQLMEMANRSGTTWIDTLNRIATNPDVLAGIIGDDAKKPTFNFVSRDYLPADPAAIDEDIKSLAKKMFAGTDIEISDEEVANLRGQFEGFLREQHFAAEQQRLSEEMAGFEAQVATSEGRQVSANVKSVPQVDAGARFRQVFEERMKPKTDAIEQMAVDDQSRQVLAGSLGQVMQFATGR